MRANLSYVLVRMDPGPSPHNLPCPPSSCPFHHLPPPVLPLPFDLGRRGSQARWTNIVAQSSGASELQLTGIIRQCPTSCSASKSDYPFACSSWRPPGLDAFPRGGERPVTSDQQGCFHPMPHWNTNSSSQLWLITREDWEF